MCRNCRPWKCYLKSCIEIASKSCANSLIGIDFYEPVLRKLTEELIFIKQKIEFKLLHYLRSWYSDKYLI